MAGYPNKIIINSNSTRGNQESVSARYDTLNKFGLEIKEHNLLVESEPLKEKMKKLCAAHDRADKLYINGLDRLIEETAALIDSRVVKP